MSPLNPGYNIQTAGDKLCLCMVLVFFLGSTLGGCAGCVVISRESSDIVAGDNGFVIELQIGTREFLPFHPSGTENVAWMI